MTLRVVFASSSPMRIIPIYNIGKSRVHNLDSEVHCSDRRYGSERLNGAAHTRWVSVRNRCRQWVGRSELRPCGRQNTAKRPHPIAVFTRMSGACNGQMPAPKDI
jgi:hypothetical protein